MTIQLKKHLMFLILVRGLQEAHSLVVIYGKYYILMVTAGMPYWGNKITLNDIINQLDNFDSDDTLYVKKAWKPDSEVVVAAEPDDGGVSDQAAKINAEYFIEIFLAIEFLEDWLSNLNQKPSAQDRYLLLIQYAINDA